MHKEITMLFTQIASTHLSPKDFLKEKLTACTYFNSACPEKVILSVKLCMFGTNKLLQNTNILSPISHFTLYM